MASGSNAELAAPEFRVRVNGRDLPPDAETDVKTVIVHEDVDAPSMCSFEIVNWDEDQQKVKWSDSDDFKPGVEVEILIGYRDSVVKVFNGEITGLELKIHGRETLLLRVRCHDRRHRLMRGKKSATYVSMKDSDIASQIASKAGLSPQTDDTSVQHEHIYQHNQTDLEFLIERAARINFEVVVDEKKLLFRPRKNDQGEVVTLDREMDIVEFYPRLTTMNQVAEIGLRGWDPEKKEAIAAKASAGQENSKMGGASSGPSMAKEIFGAAVALSISRPVANQAEADQFSKGRLNEMALAFITGDGVAIGNPKLRAGKVIKIVGLGKRFSGQYYLTSVMHTYSGKGYRTAFSVRRNAA